MQVFTFYVWIEDAQRACIGDKNTYIYTCKHPNNGFCPVQARHTSMCAHGTLFFGASMHWWCSNVHFGPTCRWRGNICLYACGCTSRRNTCTGWLFLACTPHQRDKRCMYAWYARGNQDCKASPTAIGGCLVCLNIKTNGVAASFFRTCTPSSSWSWQRSRATTLFHEVESMHGTIICPPTSCLHNPGDSYLPG
jgi:hypothetical protein